MSFSNGAAASGGYGGGNGAAGATGCANSYAGGTATAAGGANSGTIRRILFLITKKIA